eukprot:1161623-Pelagomonas_calceolata.AAC.15
MPYKAGTEFTLQRSTTTYSRHADPWETQTWVASKTRSTFSSDPLTYTSEGLLLLQLSLPSLAVLEATVDALKGTNAMQEKSWPCTWGRATSHQWGLFRIASSEHAGMADEVSWNVIPTHANPGLEAHHSAVEKAWTHLQTPFAGLWHF